MFCNFICSRFASHGKHEKLLNEVILNPELESGELVDPWRADWTRLFRGLELRPREREPLGRFSFPSVNTCC